MSKPAGVHAGSSRPSNPASPLLPAPRCLTTSRMSLPVHGVSTTGVTTAKLPSTPAGQPGTPIRRTHPHPMPRIRDQPIWPLGHHCRDHSQCLSSRADRCSYALSRAWMTFRWPDFSRVGEYGLCRAGAAAGRRTGQGRATRGGGQALSRSHASRLEIGAGDGRRIVRRPAGTRQPISLDSRWRSWGGLHGLPAVAVSVFGQVGGLRWQRSTVISIY